mmetsp:Transcript_36801/g.41550  ORF Transcript_36801/g.41550 Transcript_36801/m.41550 type:complete len:182 (+) Transcript_36801:643-1188(+)
MTMMKTFRTTTTMMMMMMMMTTTTTMMTNRRVMALLSRSGTVMRTKSTLTARPSRAFNEAGSFLIHHNIHTSPSLSNLSLEKKVAVTTEFSSQSYKRFFGSKRPKWKGPFVKELNVIGKQLVTLPRSVEITSKMVGLACNVHSGRSLIKLSIIDEMIGHKVGEFVPTRAIFVYKKKKKGKN